MTTTTTTLSDADKSSAIQRLGKQRAELEEQFRSTGRDWAAKQATFAQLDYLSRLAPSNTSMDFKTLCRMLDGYEEFAWDLLGLDPGDPMIGHIDTLSEAFIAGAVEFYDSIKDAVVEPASQDDES